MKIQKVIDTYMYKYTYARTDINVFFTNRVYIWTPCIGKTFDPAGAAEGCMGDGEGMRSLRGHPALNGAAVPAAPSPTGHRWPGILTPFVLKPDL